MHVCMLKEGFGDGRLYEGGREYHKTQIAF